jgi:hypothetical protein
LALACTLLALLGAVLAGCGSSSPGGTSADPASAVPGSAALYAGATVLPGGAQKTAALAAGRALTHQSNPYLRLLAALQTPGSPQLSFTREVAPWLGAHAGVFVMSLSSAASSALLSLIQQGLLGGSGAGGFPFSSSGAQGAIVMDTSNLSKARSFLQAQAKRAGAHPTSFKGVSFQATSTGLAFGVVRRFAVIGSESALHSVIETTLGSSSLAQAAGYVKLLAAAPANALAHIYTAPAGVSPLAGASGAPGASGLLQLLAGTREANISLVPSADSLTLDADTLATAASGSASGLLAADPESAQALEELPGEAWFAIGLGHFGTNLAADIQGLRTFSSLGSTLGGSGPPEAGASLSLSGLLAALITPLDELGANIPQAKRDFASWMGSAGMFASGASLFEIRGAVVIESTNPAHSRAAVAELAAQLRKAGATVSAASVAGTEAAVSARLSGLPLPLYIADGRNAAGQSKFVLGIGEPSVAAALDPTNTLASAASRSAAASALGEGIQPSMIVDFPTLLGLLESIGLTEDPTISKFIPYLRSATTLAGGGHSLGGEVERFKLTIGLQQQSTEASG